MGRAAVDLVAVNLPVGRSAYRGRSAVDQAKGLPEMLLFWAVI